MLVNARKFLVAVLIALVAFPTGGFAWNASGHMVVAAIAYARLTPKAKAEADRLLAIPIEPVAITKQSLDFVNAGHWADGIRSDPVFSKPFSPYHFINTPFSTDGTPIPANLPNKQSNLYRSLNEFTEVLRTSKDDNEKAAALRWLIHLVGDVHQPLHTTANVSKATPLGDGGGNGVKITARVPANLEPTDNLHSYWDAGVEFLPKSGMPGYVAPSIATITPIVNQVTALTPASNRVWAKAGTFAFESWGNESFRIATAFTYPKFQAGQAPNAAYVKEGQLIVQRRLAWAGYRLADMLNDIWK